MYSEAEKAGTPRKRVLSLGMSEDESLRHIIKEAEGSARRLSRADSRLGRRLETGQLTELQESYDEALQTVHALELQRETLQFEVDCLRDTLDGVEELLAEAHREGGDIKMELEREREKRRQLEAQVCALQTEVELLNNENAQIPAVPVYTCLGAEQQEGEENVTEDRWEDTMEDIEEEEGEAQTQQEENKDGEVEVIEVQKWRAHRKPAPSGPVLTVNRLDSEPSTKGTEGKNSVVQMGKENGSSAGTCGEGEKSDIGNRWVETTAGGILANFFTKGKEVPAAEASEPDGSASLTEQQETRATREPQSLGWEGVSVDSHSGSVPVGSVAPLSDPEKGKEAQAQGESQESNLAKFQKIVHKIIPGLQAATEPQDDSRILRGPQNTCTEQSSRPTQESSNSDTPVKTEARQTLEKLFNQFSSGLASNQNAEKPSSELATPAEIGHGEAAAPSEPGEENLARTDSSLSFSRESLSRNDSSQPKTPESCILS
ncbi:leucine-rich repeat flightless-interacting protein 1 [Amia ocellicauda]|uniref:leucine-rich repeat flightless-interacting protein 1 n=1 Tax=Amia ocellicauda TaxID=2972642 RepID=UPI003464144A